VKTNIETDMYTDQEHRRFNYYVLGRIARLTGNILEINSAVYQVLNQEYS